MTGAPKAECDTDGGPTMYNFGITSLVNKKEPLQIGDKVTHRLIDLLAIQQKSLDRALSLYTFIQEIRSSGVRASITIVHFQKFYKMLQSIVRLRFFFRLAERSITSFTGLPSCFSPILHTALSLYGNFGFFGNISNFHQRISYLVFSCNSTQSTC